MRVVIKIMKYLMYGVFALLFMMSWALFGKEPEWAWVMLNVPALLYVAARMLFVLLKNHRPWAIAILMIAVGCLELVLFNGSYTPMGFYGPMIYGLCRFAYGRLKGINYWAISKEPEILPGPDVARAGPGAIDPARQYY